MTQSGWLNPEETDKRWGLQSCWRRPAGRMEIVLLRPISTGCVSIIYMYCTKVANAGSSKLQVLRVGLALIIALTGTQTPHMSDD